MNPSREDYLLFARYSDQIDRAVRNEVDACASAFPSRQPFHTPMPESAFRARLAEAQKREYDHLTITEAPRPLYAETSWHEDDDYAKHDQRSVWPSRRGIKAGMVLLAAIAGVVWAAIEIGKWIVGVR